MPAAGKTRNKGGGRKGHGLETRIIELKGTLIDAVLLDCKTDSKRKLFWAEKFVNRLMPNEIKGSGDNGEFLFKIVGGSYEL